MEPQNNNLDEYFQKALTWYNQKYLLPLTYRSYAICLFLISTFLLGIIILQILGLLPIATSLKYAVRFNDTQELKEISINSADYYASDPLRSIAKILVENYIAARESYDYFNLKKQLIFINANSTRSIFDQYYSFLKVENQLSPVLRYKDQVKVSAQVLYTLFESIDSAVVQFRTIARDGQDKVIEQILWQSDINFKIDPIDLNRANASKFNFLVTNYKIKLVKNEI
jgi:type IV secretion system protein VirB8